MVLITGIIFMVKIVPQWDEFFARNAEAERRMFIRDPFP
jgi:hypothetical protein